MSNDKNKRKGGPMGGGPMGGMQAVVEKPKNFKGSFKKLVN
jgi:ATP-binding cassette subfamily B protein